MEYILIATKRETGEDIEICRWENYSFLEKIALCFSKSDTLSRFAIVKNNEMVYERLLEPKGKEEVKCLKRKPTKDV